MKWAELSLDLVLVVLSNETTKSLMMDMGKKVEAINHTLTKAMERISSYECEVIPLRNSA